MRSWGVLSGVPAFCVVVGCQSVPTERPSVDALISDNQSDIKEVGGLDGSSEEDAQLRDPVDETFFGVVEYGTGLYVAPPVKRTAEDGEKPSDKGVSFQFRDAPLDVVLSQVLGEGFDASYIITPDVSGRITLRLDGVTDVRSAVDALNAALESQRINISRSATGYLVSRRSGSKRGGDGQFDVIVDGEDAPNGESAVLLLKHANPDKVVSLAKPILPDGVIKTTDAARGLILLQGSQRNVAAAVDALRSFDVDWFAATSNAFVQLEAAQAEEIKSEMDEIFGRTGGVEIVALPRLHAVMVFARSRELLDRTQGMINQLDRRRNQLVDSQTLIYEARYISAERLKNAADGLVSVQMREIDSGGDPTGKPVTRRSLSTGGASNGVKISVDDDMNLVLAMGQPNQLEWLKRLFQRIDVPQPQILIEATIVEVSLRDELKFGVQWDGLAENINFTFADNTAGQVVSKFPGLSLAYTNTDITSVVNALNSQSDIQVVSSPRILALNNQTARIQVGDQVPIVTQSAVSVIDPDAPIVNATTYRDTGVILDVTPRVRGGGMIEVEVSQEVSDVAETVTSGIDSPTISQRKLQSVLSIPDGATVAMGGLISSNITESNTGVPLLKEIPGLGRLFKSTSDVTRRTELVVLLRPKVVKPEYAELDLSARLSEALNGVRTQWAEIGS